MLPALLETFQRFHVGVKSILLAAFFLLLLIFVNNINVLPNSQSKLSLNITPTPTAVPKYYHYPVPVPLPQGKQTYQVSRGAGSPGPNIQQVAIEPFDPKKGETQKIAVKVGSNAAMKAVQVTLNTDYDVKTYDAVLKEGTKINGVWEAAVTVSDSHDYVYRVTVDAEDSVESATVTVTIR